MSTAEKEKAHDTTLVEAEQQHIESPSSPPSDLVSNREDETADKVTFKTWLVVFALSMSYGISFWPVPIMGTIQAQLAVILNDPPQSAWLGSVYNIATCISFMLCGANSDLFGRRWFLIGGNVLMVVGSVVVGSANTTGAAITGMVISGFAGGNCQISAFAIPELLPNKWRHIGVVIADAFVYVDVIAGPIVARYGLAAGSPGWRWLFYSTAFGNGLVAVALILWYFPPRHPRGIPFGQAFRELDYVGGVLFTAAVSLILVGVVYASYLPSNDGKVIGPLVSGFATLVAFACWETWVPLKQPLTPPRLFKHNYGRSLSAPMVVTFSVTIYYLGTNVIWSTIIGTIFTTPSSPTSLAAKYSLAQGMGVLVGAICLSTIGTKLKHWKWSQCFCVTMMTMFGGLLALTTENTRAMSIVFCFFCATFYGWAQYLSITYVQFGAEQTELGIAGGLAGTGRYAGTSVASTVYVTILSNAVSSNGVKKVIPAVMRAGASRALAQQVLAALPSGLGAVAAVPGTTDSIVAAAALAWRDTYVAGVRTVALASIAFGALGAITCLFLEDITPKMNEKIEIYLENDVNAGRNVYH
ncbi:hypothetical protein AYO21_09066 [Fonsecaea monophora]|uniref:Major facilitator superfamily (MFS) profile domain-containing protein n=1 Tax=Fonsecaea monophora TaxID=254056 RepID=A0A177F048_9EURO|nr:hypothetical protein AYO21_09066 [Fonsecaea monophora]OAG36682.1 hypothetical protein AYO21_09066 [Fonsecaea monophora]